MPSRRDFIAGVGSLAGAAALSPPATAADPPALTWERTYAPVNQERALVRDLVPISDGIALVGHAGDLEQYRGWVGSVDLAGRSRWHRLEGAGQSAFFAGAPTVDDSDDVLAVGVTNGPADPLGPEHADPFVARASADGEVPWSRTYQPAASDGEAEAIVSVADGYVVAGSETVENHERPWAALIDGHGTRTWRWHDDRAGNVNDAIGVSSGVVVSGSTWPPGTDAPEPRASLEGAWVANLTADGDVAWRWSVDREKGDRVEALAPGPDGGVVAVGRRGFTTDDRGVGWLVALDAAGNRRWEQTYPQDGWNWHHDVASVGDGYVLVGTREEGPDTDDRGAWLLRVDAEGQVVWDYQAATGTRGFAVIPLADDGLLVGGDTHVDARDREEAWLAKIGGDSAPSPAIERGPVLPSLPGWIGPFLAGGALGALGAGAAAYRRQS